jgi:glycine betaine/proline transport system substrate-binding protein
MKTGLRIMAVAAWAGLATVGLLATHAQADAPESQKPIKIAMTGYSGDNIVMYIYGELLEKLGYKVEYTPADYIGHFTAVEAGDIAIASVGWDTTAKDVMAKGWDSGKLLNMGNIGISAHEDWWYPDYVKEVCPGLPDWTALKDPKCVEALTAPETEPKARFLAGPIEWGGTDVERIKALGLDFEVINAGSDGALSAELVAAIKRKQPIIAWTWEPYWVPALYAGEFVEFPEYDDACYNDPAWGVNKELAYDCGRPMGSIWKSAWAGGEEIWPKAYDVLRKMTLDSKTAGELVYQSDVDGVPTKEVAKQWIDKHEAIWSEWLK